MCRYRRAMELKTHVNIREDDYRMLNYLMKNKAPIDSRLFHSSVNPNALLPGDMVLYTPNEEVFKGDIADSTKGNFFHVGLILKSLGSSVYETLHTGGGGAYIRNENFSIGIVSDGVFIVRVKTKISASVIYAQAQTLAGTPYDSASLFGVGLAAWDRRCLQNKSLIFRLFGQKLSKKIISFVNRKGSLKICSGLTLDVLSKSIVGGQKLFKGSPVALSQMSPNCIYFEAVLDVDDFEIFCLSPMSSIQLDRRKKYFIRAGLCLLNKVSPKAP